MIRKLIDPGVNAGQVNIALLFLRVMIGILMLTHGTGKLITLSEGGPFEFADPLGIGMGVSLVFAVFAEFFCSMFLIFGIGTRLAAVPLIITMLVAGFIIHAGDAFLIKEKAFFYLVVYITLAITGAGKFSVDNLIYRRIENR